MPSVYSMVARYGLAGSAPPPAIRASRRILAGALAAEVRAQVGGVASVVLPSGIPAGGAFGARHPALASLGCRGARNQ